MAELTDENQAERFGEVTEREVEDSEDTSEEVEQSTETDNSENTGETDKTAETEVTETKEPVLTDKGTKLDPNPESAAHQLLANERRVRAQMEQVLGDPEKLTQFMEKQYGIKSQSKVEAEPTKSFTADDFQSLDDVARVVNTLKTDFVQKTDSLVKENQQLKETVGQLQQGGRAQQLFSTMSDDVSSLRQEPELNPKSPDFIEGLEERIADRYKKLDFEENTGTFRGGISLSEVGKDLIDVARLGKKKGSLQTQTVVKNKSEGEIRTSTGVKDEVSGDKLSAGDSISLGIAKKFGR